MPKTKEPTMIDRLTAADRIAATPIRPKDPAWTIGQLTPAFTSRLWAITTDTQLAHHQGHANPKENTMTYLFKEQAAVVDLEFGWDELDEGLTSVVEKVTFYDTSGYDSVRTATVYRQAAAVAQIVAGLSWH